MKRETIARKWLGFGLFISVTCASAQAPEDCASECNAPTVDIPVLAHAESFKLSAPPSNHRLDGQLDEWTVAGDANLFDAKVPRHEQRLWLAASDAGIVVAMQSGSLLKVEIASLDALHVPQISWRSRRIDSVWYTGLAACADEHPSEGVRYSVEDCERWYAEQVAYRRELAHEFVRRFEIETDGTVIDVDGARTRHLVLRPNGMPQVKAVAKYERATDLEMLIPWEALPLADNVELSKLYLRIRRCAVGSTGGIAHCADATESRDLGAKYPARQALASATGANFLELQLHEPRGYQVTPCAFPLLGDLRNGLGSMERGYFLPGPDSVIDRVASLHQPGGPYFDVPQGRSPTPHLSLYGSERLGDGEYLCFPRLTWIREDARVEDERRWLEPDARFDRSPDQASNRNYRSLPIDGANRLVISGPFERGSISGMGQCGACPRAALAIWYLDRKTPALTRAFEIEEIIDDAGSGAAMEFEFSDDGRRVSSEYARCVYEPAKLDSTPQDKTDDFVRRCLRTRTSWCLGIGEKNYAQCEMTETEISPEEIYEHAFDESSVRMKQMSVSNPPAVK